ncbi:MAG: DivIVA domain-containing protein [Nitrospinales bacterium]
MRFSHLDILEQCFREKFRGYNKQEVDTFLQLVAYDIKDMDDENQRLKEEIERYKVRINQLNKNGNGNGNVNGNYNAFLEKVKEKATKIVTLAKEQAEHHRRKSLEEIGHYQEEVKKLKQEKDHLLDNIMSSAQGYLDSLSQKYNKAPKGNGTGNKKM